MCGICGLFVFGDGQTVTHDVAYKMTEAMTHRGPDSSGITFLGQCTLGHRRLSIIDPLHGKQPVNVDSIEKEATIVYNGEIYNFLLLKKQLSSLGCRFHTDSDTEVVVLAYCQWGKDSVNLLRGMFSLAIWDHKLMRLFLARDRMGIKPLYFVNSISLFVFASEIKALFASKTIKPEIDLSSLDSFISFGYVPGSKTMFKGVSSLLPGQFMTVDHSGSIDTTRYWHINATPKSQKSFAASIEDLDILLEDTVRIHLMSEVPLGVFLSGGLDSSAVTAYMVKNLGSEVKSFSIGYEGAEETSELKFSRIVADHFKTDHYEFVLKPFDFLEAIPQLVSITEEPLVEAAAIPLYQLAKLAKPHATVLLSGEGSDEIFGGYALYQKMLRMERSRGLRRLLRLIPDSFLRGDRQRKYVDWMSSSLQQRYRGTSADVTDRIRKRLYSDDFWAYCRKNSTLDDVFEGYFKDVEERPLLDQMLYVDSKTWLVDDLLLKADKMTMAASVELRVPFLDHKVVEFAAALSPEFKIRNGEGKYILKKLMERYLPKEIIYRKKMGFAVPTQRWFSGELLGPAKDMVFSKKLMDTGWFRKKYLEEMFERHEKGKEDYSRRIFSLLVLYHWLNIFT